MSEPASNNNGNGSKALNWPTVAMIIASGGLNLFSTNQGNSERAAGIDRAIVQIRELHSALEDGEKRQKKSLDNQTQILEHDTIILKEVHELAIKMQQLREKDERQGTF